MQSSAMQNVHIPMATIKESGSARGGAQLVQSFFLSSVDSSLSNGQRFVCLKRIIGEGSTAVALDQYDYMRYLPMIPEEYMHQPSGRQTSHRSMMRYQMEESGCFKTDMHLTPIMKV